MSTKISLITMATAAASKIPKFTASAVTVGVVGYAGLKYTVPAYYDFKKEEVKVLAETKRVQIIANKEITIMKMTLENQNKMQQQQQQKKKCNHFATIKLYQAMEKALEEAKKEDDGPKVGGGSEGQPKPGGDNGKQEPGVGDKKSCNGGVGEEKAGRNGLEGDKPPEIAAEVDFEALD